ncbi:division/cell wall cluster transcriptional repressor MraZ [Wukongibacter baidiensis]|uniref:division/cell wall cluster transcriptional repressor MraZ n=1 Tax=Wukongibacter baidiensis TaxID=1723361 RepID=UPI003D7FE5B9
MFIGEYIYTIDKKGRINVPAKFRERLGETFFITKGLDNSLFVFPEAEWRNFENKLKQLPLTNRNARAFARLFFSGATECSLDKQGRVTIAQNLRDFGELEKEIAIIGVSSRIEIWSKNNWDKYNDSANISYDDIAEQMAELGI